MSQSAMNLPEGVSFNRIHDENEICQNCHTRGLDIFYEVHNIPVHSCILMQTREKATSYPKSHLRLGFCPKCGFVANTRFEIEHNEYSTQYEETQGFSGTFNAFAKTLAQRVIDKYDLHQKTILEIGCGKGEFLALMCELGDNKGIGVDPAYVPERNPDKTASKIEFIQDLYDESYAHLQADVICCRHTLEHIAPTYDFMKTLRKTIGDRKEILVFFELPDVMRVLKEGAFWDIYYEHCTYFTAGSLARVFRAAGFDVDDLYLDYDGQYIIVTAYPVDEDTVPAIDIENDLSEATQAVDDFVEKCSSIMSHWHTTIQDIVSKNQKVVIWGSGSKGVSFITSLGIGDEVEYVVDINPYKHGKFMPGSGHEIVSPEFLKDYQPDYVIVMNPIYCQEIQKDLDKYGVSAKLLPV